MSADFTTREEVEQVYRRRLKMPSNWLRHLAPVLIFLVRPFAVSRAVAERHPWEAMDRHLINTSFRELYFGVAYLAVGEAGPSGGSP